MCLMWYTKQRWHGRNDKSSVCGLGQSAPNPVVSTLKYFMDEYKEHAIDKKCRTKECKSMATIEIDAEKCKSCGLCQKKCPVNAIEGELREKRVINQEKCLGCGICKNKCKLDVINTGISTLKIVCGNFVKEFVITIENK